MTTLVLGYPDFTREFIVEADASLKGLVAVLSQQDNTGKVHVISCTSQTLTLSTPQPDLTAFSLNAHK